MLDRADIDEEQKQSILVAMACPCCGAGGMSFSVKLKRRCRSPDGAKRNPGPTSRDRSPAPDCGSAKRRAVIAAPAYGTAKKRSLHPG